MATNTRHAAHGLKLRVTTTSSDTELYRRRRSKMFCSRCVLPFLGLYLFLEEISAAVLPPMRFLLKREVNWLGQGDFSRPFDHADVGDLSVGDAGEVGRHADSRPSHQDTLIPATEHLPVHRQHQSQHQYNRKANDKKRKVAPLDSIGSFQMSSSRTRKDEPDVRRGDRNH